MAGGAVAPERAAEGSVSNTGAPIPSTDAYRAPTIPTFTPSQGNYYNPYIALNQMQGNPYMVMGGGTGRIPTSSPMANTGQGSDLADLSAAYQTTADKATAKQKADMIAQARAAELEYQRTLAAKKAIEDSKYNALMKQVQAGFRWVDGRLISPEDYNQLYPTYSSDGGGWFGGASGGLASLQGFDK